MAEQKTKTLSAEELFSRELIFSGTPSRVRVYLEKINLLLEELINLFLWVLALFGFSSLLLVLVLCAKTASFKLLLTQSFFNLFLWLGVLAGCYLWAKIKHRQILNRYIMGAASLSEPLDIYDLFSHEA